MSDRATNAELAAALAFVLQKWKGAGADHAETRTFDELLARVKDEPPAPSGLPKEPVANVYLDEPPRKRRQSTDPRLAALDAEIDRLNREVD